MKLNLSGTTLIQQLILQIVTGLIVAANTGIVKAQLTPDNTVGSTTRSDTVKGLTSDIIEGGATRGTNLFHSFTNFNVDAGKGVYFSNPADINNILTRVTGSSQSNIFGTLGVLGNANLFLINPNGISFGPNAQLDVKGSFVASTADKIVFDNYEFTTTNPTAPPLLTVNIPLGLGFRNNPGDINVNLAGSTLAFNNGQGLKVPQDKTLALIGGNVNINGNGVDAQGLRAGILSPGSQIQLGGLTQTGTVNFNENFYSTFPQGVTRGNVSLSNGAEINVRAAGGGSITINSRNLNVNGNSRVRGGIQKNLGSANAQAGNIEINNIEQVTLDNAAIANIVDEFGKGNAGDINIHSSSLTLKNGGTINTSVFAASSEGNGGNVTIDTANLTLENGSFISADTNGKGNAGNVAIKANQGVNVRGGLSSDVKGTAQGTGGTVTIDTSTLTLENGGYISADTNGKGNAGNVAIKATQGVTVGENALLSSGVNDTAQGNSGGITIDTSTLTVDKNGLINASNYGKGNAGNIAISTTNLTLKNGGYISASTYSKGDAGNIAIKSTQGVTIGGFLSNGVTDTGEGNSGGITIDTSTLTVDKDGYINASTFGKGDAGNITINATQGVTIGGGLSNGVTDTGEGNSGGITIDTSTLNLENGGIISTNILGKGNAGNITINATQGVTVGGLLTSGVFSTIETIDRNSGGKVTINTSTLTLENGGSINASTLGKGDAGNIAIKATQGVNVRGRLTSDVKDKAQGNSGGITIDTSTLTLENGGFISASTSGKGNAGKIEIQATEGVTIGGFLTSGVNYTGVGNSGGITIDTSTLTLENGGFINASTFGKGNAGNIAIKASQGVTIGGFLTSGVFNTGVGNSGGITIDTSTLTLENGGFIDASTNGIGHAGNIDITAKDSVKADVKIDGFSGIRSNVNPGAKGNAGNIKIDLKAGSLSLTNGGGITSFIRGYETLRDGTIVKQRGDGKGGKITINAGDINIKGFPSQINTSTAGIGDAGDIDITASNITIDDQGFLSSLVSRGFNDNSFTLFNDGEGKGGNIKITTSNLTLENGGFIDASTNGIGDAGNIDITAKDSVKADVKIDGFSGIRSNVNPGAKGNAGNIKIDLKAGSLSLTNGGGITSFIRGYETLRDGTIVKQRGDGKGGKITINAGDINIKGFPSQINTSTAGIGDAGDIDITASNITIDDQGFLSSLVSRGFNDNSFTLFNDGEGKGGNIKITTSNLTLENGGFIDASTNGIGDAGNIDITAKDSVKADVKIDGFNGIRSDVNPGAKGNAGNIDLNLKAGSLSLTNGGGITSLIRGYETLPNGTIVKQRGDGNGGKITIKAGDINIKGRYSDNNSSFSSQINTGTGGIGNAGDIDIKASNITIDDQGFVGSIVYRGFNDNSFTLFNDGEGKGGNIKITTSNLTLENSGLIITDTRANGDAGNIKLDITDNLKLSNSTISSSATSDSTGKAGNINIDPTLIELDSSQITVNSQGSGDGGNITLIGDNLNLNNSTISASTKSGQGGDITLNIPDTIRQNNSKIEASAGENGNGGNVTINTKFIIGNGGNISANATQGKGGNIKITTQGIFGYKGKQIDASSETGVDGVVETNTPEVDPSQGLIDLPENLLTATIITNSCRQGQSSQNSNSLIVKGRGGLALTSDQLPSSSEVEVSLIAPTSVKSSSAINSTSANMEKTAFKTIIPAQGWEINSQGDVVLVGHSTGNPAERVNTAITCASN
ncbi:filamentous hemagglutinin N-terminal domain-containing protein [Anabaena sp. 54]|uniref:beta strand repeat-containing protein n=1 Tax=Anabaena sp. 54 TaxID=46231 RepID=UPI0025BED842|nr:filamentous hemagglutinin N-terminal domain-containing protein [Anabaena sp. 54]MBO1063363.1 S-layer family protein [Anabaena sp. 54]